MSRWHLAERELTRISRMRPARWRFALIMAVVSVLFATANTVVACPFCAAVSPSLSDRLKVAKFAVVARMLDDARPRDRYVREIPFAPLRFLKGDVAAFGAQQIMAPIPQDPLAADHFFTMGAPEADVAGGDRLVWSLPVPVSEAAADYIAGLDAAPAASAERVAYFIPYLNHPDPLIARDAYDEFGAAPYDHVKAVAEELPRDKLKAWIGDESIPANDRRLYLTLLGVCGEAADSEELFAMIERSVQTEGSDSALDAMIACYLTLAGDAGLAPINQLILQDPDSSLGDLQSAVLALRFHGEEETRIERSKLLESMRLLLVRPSAADLVIRDLARWEDWSVLDQVIELFRQTSAENAFLRVPIVKYLQACPLPEAAAALAAIEVEYPDVVARANVLPFELGQRRKPEDAKRLSAGTPASADQAESAAARQDDVAPQDSATAEESNTPPDSSDATSAEDDSPAAQPAPPSSGPFTNLNVGFMLVGFGLLAIVVIFLILRV